MINYFALPSICARSLVVNRRSDECTLALSTTLLVHREMKFGKYPTLCYPVVATAVFMGWID